MRKNYFSAMFLKSVKTILYCLFLFAFYPVFGQADSNREIYIQKKLRTEDSLLLSKRYDEALMLVKNLENTFSFSDSDRNKLQIDYTYVQILYESGNKEKALEIALKNVEKLKIQNYQKLYIEYVNFLSRVFAESRNFDKATFYNKQALQLARRNEDTLNILKCLVRLGSFYYENEKLDSAKIYFREAIRLPVNKENEQRISNAYNNLGVIAQVEDNYDLAKGYNREALAIKKKVGDTLSIAYITANLGNLYHFEKNYKEAIKNYEDALISLESDSSFTTKVMERAIYENLAISYDSLRIYNLAYENLRKSYYLYEDINKTSLSESLAEVEAKYNVEVQEHQTEIQRNKALRARILFYGLAFLTLVSVILGVIFYNNYKLKQRNRLELLQNESQLRVINATIDAKEKERRNIAAILHDSVSALLSSANLHLQAAMPHFKKEVPVEITKAQHIIDEASVKIRDLSHQLISSVLMKFGLAMAVQDLCQKYSNSKLEFTSYDKGIQRYNQKFEIKIYHIIEELVNNIIKHSKAKNASITLAERSGDQLVIQIIDDGDGFDLKTAKEKNGLGLSHIESRIKYMRGVFNINTKKGEGTSVYIAVPIYNKEDESFDL